MDNRPHGDDGNRPFVQIISWMTSNFPLGGEKIRGLEQRFGYGTMIFFFGNGRLRDDMLVPHFKESIYTRFLWQINEIYFYQNIIK